MSLTNLAAYVTSNFGPVKGKKAFQKVFYFLTECGVPTGLNYSLYHYGPYSSDLDYNTEQLELSGAIKVIPKGRGYEIIEGDKAQLLSNNVNIENSSELINVILKELPLDNPMQLELLSTTHYAAKVQKEIYDETNVDEVVNEVINIKKTKFTKDEIEKAYHFLKERSWI